MAAQKQPGILGVDVGLTNTDVAWLPSGKLEAHADAQFLTQPSSGRFDLDALAHIMSQLGVRAGVHAGQLEAICVTGGQTRQLPDQFDGTPLVKVGEIDAIGCGGLALAQQDAALVVSAGSGTAMVSARRQADGSVIARHVTGTAVGGGTLQGLARLLLGTTDPNAINALAEQGHANGVDLTLIEATGGAIGHLPADANAVNFGKLARANADVSPKREDVASGLVRLVSQVIAVIAINAANAERLPHIVVIGHLADLPSVRKVLSAVAGYYDAKITVPPNPGYGTALGAAVRVIPS